MKKLFSLLIVIGFGHSLISQNYSPEVEAKIKQVEENIYVHFKIEGSSSSTLKERMAFFKIVGLSIAVVNDYKIEWAKGYGWADSAEKRPVTPETTFEPGSISKSLNSVGILKLAQDKKIDLYADINTYLTSWKFPYDKKSGGKKITTANLLSHTAGLTVHGFPGYEIGAPIPTLQQILDGKKPANTPAVRSEFEPGKKFMYSGGGTTISQLMLNDITKQPYDVWMYENVLKPIGMTNSSYSQPQPKEKQNVMATGYMPDGPVKHKYHVYPEQAAAGLWTTPTDLCKFIIETQLSLQGKSNKILSKETTSLQLTAYVDKPTGLGVFLQSQNGVSYFSHGAGNEGFSGIYFGSFEDGKGVAIVCNSVNGSKLMNQIVNSVARVYQWKDFLNPQPGITKKEVKVNDNIAKKYIGFYKGGTVISQFVRRDDGFYFVSGQEPWKVFFTSDTSFINLESLSEKTIRFDKKGNVTGLKRTVFGKEADGSEKIELVKLSVNELQKFTGKYSSEGTILDVILENNDLLAIEGTDKYQLKFISPTEFFVTEDPGAIYKYITNKKGEATGCLRLQNEQTQTFKKIK